jgi:hypothetical protein
LYRIDTVIPKLTKVENAKQVQERAAEHITTCLEQIESHKERLQKIIEDNGLDGETVEYTRTEMYTIHISSPTSARLVQLFTQLDEALSMVEFLWIAAALDMDQHVAAPRQLTRLVLHATRQITALQQQFENAFRNLNDSQHAEALEKKEDLAATKAAARKQEQAAQSPTETEDKAKTDEDKPAKAPKRTRAKKPEPNGEGVIEITAEDIESDESTPKEAAAPPSNEAENESTADE